MNAQRARGVDFGEGKLVQRLNLLFHSNPFVCFYFKRADALAIMEARGYNEVKVGQLVCMEKNDSLAIISLLILGILLLY